VFSLVFLLFVFLISIIPSAITRDAPHTLRSIVFLPLSTVIIGLGLNRLWSKLTKLTIVFVCLVLVVQQWTFWPQYFNYATDYSQSWQYGYQQAIAFTKQNYSKYDNIVFTKKYGETHQFVLFIGPGIQSITKMILKKFGIIMLPGTGSTLLISLNS